MNREYKVCPDCGKSLEKGEVLYKVYRDRYKSEKSPEGKKYVCKGCY